MTPLPLQSELRATRKFAVRNTFAGLLMLLAFLSLYLLSVMVPPGLVTFWISTVALALIWFTAVARVNDIGAELHTARWHVRRLGLVLVGCGCIGVINQITQDWNKYPTWNEVVLRVGFALTWMTTPNMPPFFHFIAGWERRSERRTQEPQL